MAIKWGDYMKKTGYPSIDKPWEQYYSNSSIKQNEVRKAIEKSMFQMLDECTTDIEDLIAIEYFGQDITYKEFKKRIYECAKSFLLLGVKKGDIVPLILPNQPESRIMIYALNIIGATAYPIQPSISPKQLNEIIYQNNVRNLALFRGFYRQYKVQIKDVENVIYTTGKESMPKIIQLADKISHVESSKVIPYSEFELESKSYTGIITPVYEKDKTAAIIGTSGTTGIPKGTCLSNENVNAMALQHLLGDMGLERGDVLLNILIDSIGYGLGTMHYSGCCGFKSILYPKLETDMSKLFLKYRPQHFTGGPIHAETLEKYLKNPKNEKNAEELIKILQEMKNWVTGGAPLKSSTEEFFNNLGITLRNGLGCTENGGAATFEKKGAEKKGSVGIPLMLETMSIFKVGTDEELKYNEPGEICITGPTVMQKYLNNPEETAKTIKLHRDGRRWIHTGDEGYMDEDGHVYIIGRYKKMTHRLGFNIHPQTIADDLSRANVEHVNEYHVITVPHPQEQNVPVAFIAVEPSININKIKKDLIEYAKVNLSQYDIPYDYVFVIGNLPRNIGGKVDDKKLLEFVNLDYEKLIKPQYPVITIDEKIKKKRK